MDTTTGTTYAFAAAAEIFIQETGADLTAAEIYLPRVAPDPCPACEAATEHAHANKREITQADLAAGIADYQQDQFEQAHDL